MVKNTLVRKFGLHVGKLQCTPLLVFPGAMVVVENLPFAFNIATGLVDSKSSFSRSFSSRLEHRGVIAIFYTP